MWKVPTHLRVTYGVLSGISLIQWAWVTLPGILAGGAALVSGYPLHIVILTVLGAVAFASVGLAAWSVHVRVSQTRAAIPTPGKPHSALLYLTTVPYGELFRHTGYWAQWSPTEPTVISFRDHDPRARAGPPKHQRLTFHLFNAGPSDVRHIRLTWMLANVNLPKLIKETGLFEGYIDELSPSRLGLIMDSAHQWMAMPISTEVQDSGIPILKVGESVVVRSPIAFTNAFTVYALAEAQRLINSYQPPEDLTMRSIARQLERSRMPIQDVTIHAQFETDEGVQRQAFSMIGWLQGVGAVRPAVVAEDGSETPAEGAIAAWIDYVEVLDHDQPRQSP